MVIKKVDAAKGQQTHPGVYVESGGGIPIWDTQPEEASMPQR